MFTIGGGYAMIPLIEREVVNRGWLDKQDFMDLFAMTQSLPGIFAVNISIFVGYKLKKVTGSIVCAGGTILPSFCIILAIALFFNHFQDNIWVMKIFNGIRPAVVALILVPCISAARSLHLKCFGRYYRRIDLYLLDQRKNETGERRVESEKEDGEIKEK